MGKLPGETDEEFGNRLANMSGTEFLAHMENAVKERDAELQEESEGAMNYCEYGYCDHVSQIYTETRAYVCDKCGCECELTEEFARTIDKEIRRNHFETEIKKRGWFSLDIIRVSIDLCPDCAICVRAEMGSIVDKNQKQLLDQARALIEKYEAPATLTADWDGTNHYELEDEEGRLWFKLSYLYALPCGFEECDDEQGKRLGYALEAAALLPKLVAALEEK